MPEQKPPSNPRPKPAPTLVPQPTPISKPQPEPSQMAADYVKQSQQHDKPPKNALFDDITKKADLDLNSLLEKFRGIVNNPAGAGVKVEVPFLPYLLIRQTVGDHGERPITSNSAITYKSMPDIWVFRGDPATAPPIPAGPGFETGGVPVVHMGPNSKYTIYAHVWNLGRAPIAGVKVEFFWFEFDDLLGDPTDPLVPSRINRLGIARVDLQGRSSLGCHQLVKCPEAFEHRTSIKESYRLAMLVHVSSLGDPVLTPYHALGDRHVGRRDFTNWVSVPGNTAG